MRDERARDPGAPFERFARRVGEAREERAREVAPSRLAVPVAREALRGLGKLLGRRVTKVSLPLGVGRGRRAEERERRDALGMLAREARGDHAAHADADEVDGRGG